ncbi:hypothetical protein VHEMI09146 [[Torrubiella] hemipterigena]|uniref:Uncharacterized protein n=1 Tax=[Torrubiella] hemipterigena TaxID=1531966 RepID=A0A0A1T8W7_9HYPO|nr:hypothetical protein VHEMI09146 [[Torrubiella] hemipterigena]
MKSHPSSRSAPKDAEMLLGGSLAGTPGAKPVPLRIMRKPVAVHSPWQGIVRDEEPRRSLLFKRKAIDGDANQYAPLVDNPELHRVNHFVGWGATLRVWSWEIAALAVSGIALMAIIITLRQFEDASIKWWKAPISINAAVAILSALFRGLLFIPISNGLGQLKWLSVSQINQRLVDMNIYDQASRGVWGSVVLLAKQFTSRRLSFIASIGAILGLIALITEPFSQAAVSIGSCERPFPHQAALPRANGYADAPHVGAGINELTSQMQFAALSGFYNPPKDLSDPINGLVTCPTGNCSFSNGDDSIYFETIDLGSSCKDISSKIKLTVDSFYPRSYLSGYANNITLTSLGKSSFDPRGTVLGFMSTPALGEIKEPWPDGPWKSTSLVSFQGMAGMLENGSLYPRAFDCSLRPCVRSLSATVVNGKYAEKEHSRQYLHYLASTRQFELALNCTRINGTWHTCKSSATETATHNMQATPWELQQDAHLTKANNTGRWYEPKCYYFVTLGVLLGFSRYLGSTFDSAFVTVEPGSIVSGAAWAKDLWKRGNMTMDSVNKFSTGLAASIGAEMRRGGSPYDFTNKVILEPASLEVSGDMVLIEPCITVQWKYLSFLAFLWAFTALFCGAIILAQHQSRLGAGTDWKTSILPLLFQAIHNGDGLSSNASYRDSDLQRRAEEVAVQLADSDGQWVLQRRSNSNHAFR